jgi:hypothetical protein
VSDAQRLIDDLGHGWPGSLAAAARHQLAGEILLYHGDRNSALREFEAADRLDSPLRIREYLANAYASSDPERSLFLYQNAAASRGAFWQYADCELPGLRSGMLLETGRLARRLGDDTRARQAVREYLQIRQSADADIPETLQAKELLAGLHL